MQKFLIKKLSRPGYHVIIILALFIICLVTGTLFYHYFEGLRPLDAFYLTAMTLATVGYGDFTPLTDTGKLFTAAFAFIGIGVFLGLAAAIVQLALSRLHRRRS